LVSQMGRRTFNTSPVSMLATGKPPDEGFGVPRERPLPEGDVLFPFHPA